MTQLPGPERATKKTDGPPGTTHVSVLAQLSGLTETRIRQLASDGWYRAGQQGWFNTVDAISGLFRYYREGKRGGTGDAFTAERTRMTKLRADILEMEKRVQTGDLLPAETVASILIDAHQIVKTRLLASPSKLAPRVILCKTAAEAQALIGDEIEAALAELASVGPRIARVGDMAPGRGGGDSEGDGGIHAPAPADSEPMG